MINNALKHSKNGLIIFDFDDTLCPTEELGFHLENQSAQELGFAPQDRLIHKQTWGRPLPEVAPIRFPGIDVDAFMERVSENMQRFSKQGTFDVISDDTLAMLSDLERAGMKTAVLTSRIGKEVGHLIDGTHPVSKYISMDKFFYRETTVHGKPDPRVFKEITDKLGCDIEHAVYVGDSPSDGVCAKLGGLSFIATLESGLREKTDFIPGTVDVFIDRLGDIPQALDSVARKRKVGEALKRTDVELVLRVAGETISVPHDYFMEKFPEVKMVVEALAKQHKK